MTDPSALDGNAAAGPFAEVFGADVTTVIVTCAGCRASAPFAEQAAYVGTPAPCCAARAATTCSHASSRRRPSCGWR